MANSNKVSSINQKLSLYWQIEKKYVPLQELYLETEERRQMTLVYLKQFCVDDSDKALSEDPVVVLLANI